MKKKWQKNVAAILKSMGFSREKVAGGLTAEEWKGVEEAYQKAYGNTLADDKAAGDDADPDPDPEPEATTTQLSDEERTAIADMLGVPADTVAQEAAAAAQQAAQAAAAARQQAAQMAHQPETRKPAAIATMKRANIFGGAHTATHLFGIEHELYDRSKPYNQLTGATVLTGSHRSADVEAARKDFLQLSQIVTERYAQLREAGALANLTMAALASGKGVINMAPPTVELGEYLVRRTDAIIAHFKSIPTVRGSIFPVHSNVQNGEVAISAIIGELSQGYRAGRIFKGGMEFQADKYKVDDLMFKFNFTDLIQLEKEYIGWMNRNEGSAIIKWTFIEWVLVHYGEQLIKEQNERDVIGCRVPQQNVKANPANLAADGVLRAIIRAIHQYRVLPFWGIGAYDADTMLDTVEAFADKVVEVHGSLDDLKIYLNKRHQRWYIRAYREKYGKDADFTGASATLVDLDPASIIWVPNMGLNDYMMLASEPGNIELLEDKPGEMLNFDFTTEFEGVAVKSRWKQGAHVVKAGAKYPTQAALVKSNFAHQFIYVNTPTTEVALAATLDLSGNTMFFLTGDTAVTTVNGLQADRVFTLYAKAAGVKVNKSGAFSKISADFTAVAAGDYIEVYPELEDVTETIDGQEVTFTRPTGKLLELDRYVTSA